MSGSPSSPVDRAPAALNDAEERVLLALSASRTELVDLATALIAFDTTTRDTVAGPRQEQDLQAYLGWRLRRIGAEVDIWEPEPDSVPPSRQVPTQLNWEGYPQLVARLPGTGGGRSLLLNGHIDTVSPEPVSGWTSNPFQAEVRKGMLHGRGAVDMKGGVASIVCAVEALRGCGVRLAGDLLVNTVTDEESTSAGALAVLARGVRADACVVGEPTGLGIGVACRGSLMPTVTIQGRAGHAAAVQPHWQLHGAVSATEKAALVLRAVTKLRETWRDEPGHRHRYLPPGMVVATTISGGQWPVSWADSCHVNCHISYQPGQADADGYGSKVERDFTDWVTRFTATDPWLAAHPPQVTWSSDVPPAEISPNQPVVRAVQDAVRRVGGQARIFGADFWHDGASFTRAGIPSLAFGPGHVRVAHAVDEHVSVDQLIKAAQVIALSAMRYCGVS